MAAMFQDKYVFSQLTAFLNRTQFNNYVRKYDGNRYVKHFTCWNQILAMMFGQLSTLSVKISEGNTLDFKCKNEGIASNGVAVDGVLKVGYGAKVIATTGSKYILQLYKGSFMGVDAAAKSDCYGKSDPDWCCHLAVSDYRQPAGADTA